MLPSEFLAAIAQIFAVFVMTLLGDGASPGAERTMPVTSALPCAQAPALTAMPLLRQDVARVQQAGKPLVRGKAHVVVGMRPSVSPLWTYEGTPAPRRWTTAPRPRV